MERGMLYFISGGVRSGKSTYAEQLAVSLSKNSGVVYYVATSIAYDEEIEQRVKRHQQMRNNHSVPFITYEQPIHIEKIIERFHQHDVVLIDCLTTLLSNELFLGWEQGIENWRSERNRTEIYARLINTFQTFQQKEINVILVSNELGNDLLPNDESTFYYLQMLGKLHQEIVALSDFAILVQFGIPIYIKGCE